MYKSEKSQKKKVGVAAVVVVDTYFRVVDMNSRFHYFWQDGVGGPATVAAAVALSSPTNAIAAGGLPLDSSASAQR